MPEPAEKAPATSEIADDGISKGVFWSTSDPSIRSPGRLRLTKEDSPRVTVFPALFDAYEMIETGRSADGSVLRSPELASDPGPTTVQGNLDEGTPLTLFEAISRNWNGGFTRESQEQRFVGVYAVIGAHLNGIGYQFTALRVRVQTLANPAISSPEPLKNGGEVSWVE
jgi:hypothetical protein